MASTAEEFAQYVAQYVSDECGEEIDTLSVDLPVEMWDEHAEAAAAIEAATGCRARSGVRWVRVVQVHLRRDEGDESE